MPKPDPRTVRIALATGGDLSYSTLCQVAGPASPERPGDLPPRAPKPTGDAIRHAAAADAEAARIGARIVTLGEPTYPDALYDLPQPPPVLWVRGHLPAERLPSVAMVGSRRADRYGREVAELFAQRLAAHRVSVVSGFARGIDAASHEGALAGWPVADGDHREDDRPATVAVLGTGLAVDYPRGHGPLGERIAARGALVSEFPPGTPGRPWMFPVRNRIIAALAGLTLVVRATPRSGSLSTARVATDLGRDVWAVPGRIFERRSLGTNALVADGAGLARHPRDLLDALGIEAIVPDEAGTTPPPELEDPHQAAVWTALGDGDTRSAEALAAAAGLPLAATQAALTGLELAGLARHGAGGFRRGGPPASSLPGGQGGATVPPRDAAGISQPRKALF